MKNYEAFRKKTISASELHGILEKSNMPFPVPVDIEKLIKFLNIKIENKPDFTTFSIREKLPQGTNPSKLGGTRFCFSILVATRFTTAASASAGAAVMGAEAPASLGNLYAL